MDILREKVISSCMIIDSISQNDIDGKARPFYFGSMKHLICRIIKDKLFIFFQRFFSFIPNLFPLLRFLKFTNCFISHFILANLIRINVLPVVINFIIIFIIFPFMNDFLFELIFWVYNSLLFIAIYLLICSLLHFNYLPSLLFVAFIHFHVLIGLVIS